MTMTVDVVIAGATCAALSAAIDAASQGKRVVVVAGARGADLRRRVRRARRIAGAERSKQIRVLTGAEIECVGGLRSVEAVLVRYTGTSRRVDINASALLTFPETETDDRNQTGGAHVCRVC
jgi:hypothetical protein